MSRPLTGLDKDMAHGEQTEAEHRRIEAKKTAQTKAASA